DLEVDNRDYISFLKIAYDSFLKEPDHDYVRPDGLIPYHFSRHKSYNSYRGLPYWKQMGHFCDDSITPINGDTYRISMESANNCYEAAKMVGSSYDVIYCLNTYPGHHAVHDGYSGYCYLNNAYVCAAKLMQDRKRVAILDIDTHAGTHDIPFAVWSGRWTMIRLWLVAAVVMAVLGWGSLVSGFLWGFALELADVFCLFAS